jgi:hypothetical protein
VDDLGLMPAPGSGGGQAVHDAEVLRSAATYLKSWRDGTLAYAELPDGIDELIVALVHLAERLEHDQLPALRIIEPRPHENPIRFIGNDYTPTPSMLGHSYGAAVCPACVKPNYPQPHGCRPLDAFLHGVRDATGEWIWERCDACDFNQSRPA